MPRQAYRAVLVGALLLLAVAAVVLGFASGYAAGERQRPLGAALQRAVDWSRGSSRVASKNDGSGRDGRGGQEKRPPGLWQTARNPDADGDPSSVELETITELETIGYLSGYEAASDQENVTIHVPELAYDGLNLHSSGNRPEAVLMDMDGTVLHRWTHSFRDAFPESPADRVVFGMAYWRRVHLFPNGDLLAIFEGYGLIKLDKDSNLLWAKAGRYHHDLFVDPDGRIYTLTRRAELVPRLHDEEYVLLDYVTILEPDGTVARRIPVLEAFEESPYASFLGNAPEAGDIFHTNTIEVMDGTHSERSPIFAAGNILLSMREMNVIAVMDPIRETIVWALSGQWKRQHQPTILGDGRMLLFDNLGHRGVSKVIELDPFSQEIVWAYNGTPENGFSSPSGGSNQRLGNGNTLITESEAGRAFEVTPDGQIVWEFHNMARAGENNELVANLCEVVRLDRSAASQWLPSSGG